MKNMIKIILITLGITAAMAVPAFSMSAKSANSQGIKANNDRFTNEEINIIRDVLNDIVLPATDDDYDDDRYENNKKRKGLPPGLAKRNGDLPPGLEKQIQRNGTLPPGLAKRDLPPELAARLPNRRDGREIVIVDDDVVLMETATNVVVDILADVVRRGNRR